MTVAAESGTLFRYRDGGRAKVAEEGRCRMCLTPGEPRGERQLTRHHLVDQAYFAPMIQKVAPYNPGPDSDAAEWTRLWKLRDAEANIVPICARCHRQVEADEGARAMLRKVLGAVEVAFALAVRGDEWFDERYPRLGAL